jgi:hypothetical protein
MVVKRKWLDGACQFLPNVAVVLMESTGSIDWNLCADLLLSSALGDFKQKLLVRSSHRYCASFRVCFDMSGRASRVLHTTITRLIFKRVDILHIERRRSWSQYRHLVYVFPRFHIPTSHSPAYSVAAHLSSVFGQFLVDRILLYQTAGLSL